MKKLFVLLTVLLFTNIAFADEWQEPPTQFAIVFSPGLKWPVEGGVEFSNPNVQAHAGYWKSQAALIEKGGPFAGRQGGMILLKSGISLEDAQKLATQDPAVQSQFFNVDVQTWMLFFNNVESGLKKSGEER